MGSKVNNQHGNGEVGKSSCCDDDEWQTPVDGRHYQGYVKGTPLQRKSAYELKYRCLKAFASFNWYLDSLR